MAYDEDLTSRMREALDGLVGITEKRMMGGVCFMIDGNMLSGADRQKDGAGRFMFRVGKEQEAEALTRPGAIAMELGGRRMGGLVFVGEETCDKDALKDWISLALAFVGALPAKAPKSS